MTAIVTAERPDTPDAVTLITELEAVLEPLYPSESRHGLSVERLISERTAARSRKDFKESDRIRDLLAAMGVAIKDSKDGTTWEVAR